MVKSYKYRIYPDDRQKEDLSSFFGSLRFVYNLGLEIKIRAWTTMQKNLTCIDLINQLKELKDNEAPWLKKCPAQSLQMVLRNLDNAYTQFFKGKGFPKFKNKYSKQSIQLPQGVKTNFEDNTIFLPKLKNVKCIFHRQFKGTIKTVTVSKTPTDKYFVSILVENQGQSPIKKKIENDTSVGIDLGIKNFLVTSNNEIFDNPKFLKQSLSKLKFIQKKYSKYNGKRTKKRIALLHEKISNQRKDFLHKISIQLIKKYDSIGLENLQISNMIKNHKLARSISDCGWSMFVNMLEYKGNCFGKNVIKIGKFDPSSKICSNCGNINKELQLQDREWVCKNCNSLLDRDLNAAINIKHFAFNKYVSGTDTKTRNELPTLVGVLTSEA